MALSAHTVTLGPTVLTGFNVTLPPLSHKVALSSNVTDDPKTLLKGKKYFYKCRMLAYTISSLLKMEEQERNIFVRVYCSRTLPPATPTPIQRGIHSLLSLKWEGKLLWRGPFPWLVTTCHAILDSVILSCYNQSLIPMWSHGFIFHRIGALPHQRAPRNH